MTLSLVDPVTGAEVGPRMTYMCLDPWPAAISGRHEVRWRCGWCQQEGTQAELSGRSCPAGAVHPARQDGTTVIDGSTDAGAR